MVFPLVLALLLSLIALLFAFQNAAPTAVSFLMWQFESSLAVVLVVSFAAGLLAGVLLILPARIRSGLRSSAMRKEVASLEARLAQSERKVEAAVVEAKENDAAASGESKETP